MDSITHNIIKSCAKRANDEIRQRIKANPWLKVDDICREVLKDKFREIEALGVARSWLSWHIGVLNGVVKDRRLD